MNAGFAGSSNWSEPRGMIMLRLLMTASLITAPPDGSMIMTRHPPA